MTTAPSSPSSLFARIRRASSTIFYLSTNAKDKEAKSVEIKRRRSENSLPIGTRKLPKFRMKRDETEMKPISILTLHIEPEPIVISTIEPVAPRVARPRPAPPRFSVCLAPTLSNGIHLPVETIQRAVKALSILEARRSRAKSILLPQLPLEILYSISFTEMLIQAWPNSMWIFGEDIDEEEVEDSEHLKFLSDIISEKEKYSDSIEPISFSPRDSTSLYSEVAPLSIHKVEQDLKNSKWHAEYSEFTEPVIIEAQVESGDLGEIGSLEV